MEKSMYSIEDFSAFLGNGNADEKYKYVGVKFNPFPRSGTANINDNDIHNSYLRPLDQEVKRRILTFAANALTTNSNNPADKFQSCVVLGDYGAGKTQLLMYIKAWLRMVADNPNYVARPYVIYIDNPGVSLLEFIGSIIAKIGEENLRKYLWKNILDVISNNEDYKHLLNQYLSGYQEMGLDNVRSYNPYAEENRVSYKKFLDTFVNQINFKEKRKRFDEDFQRILLEILNKSIQDQTVSYYFYEFISSDYGVNKTWEGLTNGSLKSLNRKEAKVIKYIVQLVKEQGYSDFFILVDEFEDVTLGRLTKAQIDNYIYNLRTLLDEQREWTLFFSMNPIAFKKLRSVSPPLADRISAETVWVTPVNNTLGHTLIENYMSLCDVQGTGPFTDDAIEALQDMTEGNARRFLVYCFQLIEDAAREFDSEDKRIDADFVKTHCKPEDVVL